MTIIFTSKVCDDTINNIADDNVNCSEEIKRKPTNPTLYKYKMYSRLSKSFKKRSPAVKSFDGL